MEYKNEQAMNKPMLQVPLLSGFLIITLFFGAFFFWAVLSPLDSAAIALGEVSVETKRKTIQHLEGGIIRKILVRDGDIVEAGQVLVRLDKTQPLANLTLIKGHYNASRAHEARLRAERDQTVLITFPEDLEKGRHDNSEIAEILESQERIFNARIKGFSAKEEILKQRIVQYKDEIRGLKGQVAAAQESIALSDTEIESHNTLVTQGLLSKARMLELQRDRAGIKGGKAQNLASISRVGQHIIETQMEINEVATIRMNEVVQELRDVQTEIHDLREQYRAAEDVLSRIDVIAPLAGTIVGLNVHTISGVVAPGEALMDIVPIYERMIIEARIDPMDIDIVERGLSAYVRFTALNQRHTMPVNGKVITVSADRLIDEHSGEAYYSARIELVEDLSEALGGELLHSGMQVEVMIITGERTPLEYFLQPLSDSVNRAFREA